MKIMRTAVSVLMIFCAVDVPAAIGPGGWTDLIGYIVPSDGSRSLGASSGSTFNSTRDQGSKIVYFNAVSGDNVTAEVYWWDGSRIVDSSGSPTNGGGLAYGTDPLQPNAAAIKPFQQVIGIRNNAAGDLRLRTHADQGFSSLAAGYPDWFLFRRGQVHDTFDGSMDGGRSEAQPMVIAGYGPLADGRAVMAPATGVQVDYGGDLRSTVNPFRVNVNGTYWMHEVLLGLELRAEIHRFNANEIDSASGGPPTFLMEDCKMVAATMAFLPLRSTVRRGSSAFMWDADDFNEAYFTSGYKLYATFEDYFFYKNGYRDDPRAEPDPLRDTFSRNVYQNGGDKMGHTYRNVLFADGGSGGPQMRYGGLIEHSLIVDGYWWSGTHRSHSETKPPYNPWVPGQSGQSAVVRDNVQFVYMYPTPNDPDSAGDSDIRAQPGWGYSAKSATFGAEVENNIISFAMLSDELGVADASVGNGLEFETDNPRVAYGNDGLFYTLKDNVFRNNIVWRARDGFRAAEDWIGVSGCVVENNVFVVNQAVRNASANLTGTSQLEVRNNRFYANNPLPPLPWMGAGNTLAPYAGAAAAESWSDPNRTLKRYVVEVLGLTLLDGSEPMDGSEGADESVPVLVMPPAAGEIYDPTGLKTFMAVAINMRKGGAMSPPDPGQKPSWDGDYAWDDRYTAKAVVNWIRAGFNLPPVGSGGGGGGDSLPPARPGNLRMR